MVSRRRYVRPAKQNTAPPRQGWCPPARAARRSSTWFADASATVRGAGWGRRAAHAVTITGRLAQRQRIAGRNSGSALFSGTLFSASA